MKIVTPAFGFMSGTGTAFGLLPHILTLIILLMAGIDPRSATSLIVFTIGAKLLGEWLFWKNCFHRMDSEKELKNWKSVVNNDLLFSEPNVPISFFIHDVWRCSSRRFVDLYGI